MALAVVIGVALGLAVSQAMKEARMYGHDNVIDYMFSNLIFALGGMHRSFRAWTEAVGAPLAIFIILGLPAIGVGLTVWWKLRNKKSRS